MSRPVIDYPEILIFQLTVLPELYSSILSKYTDPLSDFSVLILEYLYCILSLLPDLELLLKVILDCRLDSTGLPSILKGQFLDLVSFLLAAESSA